jgi:hypothetical protein
MKLFFLASGLLSVVSAAAMAQTAPVGQAPGGAINATNFAANTETAGFNTSSLTAALVVPSTSTTQATFSQGAVVTGTVITTKATVITTCSSTTGVTLPAVQQYEPIVLMNRSGGSCLVWPSIGSTVETALGTNGSLNAPFTMLTNTDVTFRPVSATQWLQ